jgi:hypothetical protein
MSSNPNSVFARVLARKQYGSTQHPTDLLVEALCTLGNYYESQNGTAEAGGTNLVDKFVAMLVAAGLPEGSLQIQAIKARMNSDRLRLGA